MHTKRNKLRNPMNKIKLIGSLVVAMVLSVAVSAQTLEEVNEKFNEGGAALQAKDYAKAGALFLEVVQQGAVVGADAAGTVQNAKQYAVQSFFRQGQTLAAANDLDNAIPALTKASELGELYGVANVGRQATQMLGQVYFAMGANAYNTEDYPKAIEIFGQGYAADPTNTDMALNLARSYNKQGDLAKAVEVYDAVIALEDRHSRYVEPAKEARAEKATAVLVKASEAAAANNLEEVVALTDLIPEDPTGALMRLQVANNNKDYRSVIQYGEAAAALQTEDDKKSDAYFLLGAAYQNQDNKAKAIESFRKVTAGANAAQARSLISSLQ